jgi:hypothetical protein
VGEKEEGREREEKGEREGWRSAGERKKGRKVEECARGVGEEEQGVVCVCV